MARSLTTCSCRESEKTESTLHNVYDPLPAFFPCRYAITVVPRVYTYYISSFLFAVFGLKMLKDGWKMSANEAQEEMEEASWKIDGSDGGFFH